MVNQKPFVLMFDSQIVERRSIDEIGETINSYLRFEYNRRFGRSLPKNTDLFPVVLPTTLPQQKKTNDGGPYMLEFVRRFLLQNPPMKEIAQQRSFDFGSSYGDFSIEKTREFIREVILNLSGEKDRWDSLLDGRETELQNFVNVWY